VVFCLCLLLIFKQQTFRIFSPEGAPDMQTNGAVERVHRNGLINFAGASTNSDGSSEYAFAMRALHGDDEEAAEEALEKVLNWEAEQQEREQEEEPSHFCKLSCAQAAKTRDCLTVELEAGQVINRIKEAREK
jgi:hypothetical protein